jgi:hypothetical protein
MEESPLEEPIPQSKSAVVSETTPLLPAKKTTFLLPSVVNDEEIPSEAFYFKVCSAIRQVWPVSLYESEANMHQGSSFSLGTNLNTRGELCSLGGLFTPSVTLRGEHSLMFRRTKGLTEGLQP